MTVCERQIPPQPPEQLAGKIPPRLGCPPRIELMLGIAEPQAHRSRERRHRRSGSGTAVSGWSRSRGMHLSISGNLYPRKTPIGFITAWWPVLLQPMQQDPDDGRRTSSTPLPSGTGSGIASGLGIYGTGYDQGATPPTSARACGFLRQQRQRQNAVTGRNRWRKRSFYLPPASPARAARCIIGTNNLVVRAAGNHDFNQLQ